MKYAWSGTGVEYIEAGLHDDSGGVGWSDATGTLIVDCVSRGPMGELLAEWIRGGVKGPGLNWTPNGPTSVVIWLPSNTRFDVGQGPYTVFFLGRTLRVEAESKGPPHGLGWLETRFMHAWALATRAEILPEYPVCGGKYRLDFAHLPTKTAIELDGGKYHDVRASVAITKHNQRQREIEAEGWRFIRFGALEVKADPDKCIGEVLDFIARGRGGIR